MEISDKFVIEFIAAIAGILCVFLQTREDIRAWPFGIIAVSLLAYIFFKEKLYSSGILNLIFIVLNLYGWWNWSRKDQQQNLIPITRLNINEIGIWATVVLIGTMAWGYFMSTYTDAVFVYGDAFAIVASLVASYLLALKKLENWLLWIIINIISVTIYYLQDLHLTTFLFAVYLGLGIKGYIDWKKKLIPLANKS